LVRVAASQAPVGATHCATGTEVGLAATPYTACRFTTLSAIDIGCPPFRPPNKRSYARSTFGSLVTGSVPIPKAMNCGTEAASVADPRFTSFALALYPLNALTGVQLAGARPTGFGTTPTVAGAEGVEVIIRKRPVSAL